VVPNRVHPLDRRLLRLSRRLLQQRPDPRQPHRHTPSRPQSPQMLSLAAGDDVRAGPGRGRPRAARGLPQTVDPARRVPGLPRVHRLTRHPVPDRHLTDRRPVQNLKRRPWPLLNQPLALLPRALIAAVSSHELQSSRSQTVTVKHLPTTTRQACRGPLHDTLSRSPSFLSPTKLPVKHAAA
jgi:hypothetical protein